MLVTHYRLTQRQWGDDDERRDLLGASWSRLEQPERDAWRVWATCSGQLALLKLKQSKRDEPLIVLDGAFVATVMREWEPVIPPAYRARVWTGVQALHACEYDLDTVIVLGKKPCFGHREGGELHLYEPAIGKGDDCHLCTYRFRCDTCDKDGVYHPECRG